MTWILHQVSRSAVVACDSQVYQDLIRGGFPAANLSPLGPGSNDPLGSDLVVATAAVRALFGPRLASVYAPAVIASFGSGNTRIDIRWRYPYGTAAYRTAQGPALRARQRADKLLLTNRRIKLSATARTQLLSGGIDPRLPMLIVGMAYFHPVRVVSFGDRSPGGGPADLLRSVELATVDRAAHLTPTAYLGWMQGYIDVQRTQFHPWSQQVTLSTGQAVLMIGYYAPSPLRQP